MYVLINKITLKRKYTRRLQNYSVYRMQCTFEREYGFNDLPRSSMEGFRFSIDLSVVPPLDSHPGVLDFHDFHVCLSWASCEHICLQESTTVMEALI